jgi:hypothetical protein
MTHGFGRASLVSKSGWIGDDMVHVERMVEKQVVAIGLCM